MSDEIGKPSEAELSPRIKKLHRGVWADEIRDGDLIPVGGSLFSDEMTLKAEIDYSFFDPSLENYTEEKMNQIYEERKAPFLEWLAKTGSDVDPKIFFMANQAQGKMEQLLGVVRNEDRSDTFARMQKYNSSEHPKLSEFNGISECAEQVLLTKHILDRLGIPATYCSGITMSDPENVDEYPEDHSFLVLPDTKGGTLIYDVARPKSSYNLPRLLSTDVPVTYDLLKDNKDLLVGATEVLQKGKIWYGVGDTFAGGHKSV